MYSLVKGTHDVVLNEASQFTYVEQLLSKVAEQYGYHEFSTPIIEYTELFLRSVGDSSDIVRKEMYTFQDKGDRSITLRPEITAGTIRSMVCEKLFVNQDFPVKAYYVGPCFRYERPQQGRYRQFNQFGVECAGVSSPYRDAETIVMAYSQLQMLGFKNLELKINSLGDAESRENYKKALKDFFASSISNMCEDCQERYKLNVLRILDCKVPEDQEIVKKAPKMGDYLTENAKKDFNTLLKILDDNEVKYSIDDGLVRGLDYYSGVVFEFHYTSKEGKNYGAIGAGGHYSNLIAEIGGPSVEGVGYAMGIERLVAVMNDDHLFDEINRNDLFLDAYVMPIGEENIDYAFNVTNYIRDNGFNADICLENKSMGQMFKKATRRNSTFGIIIGSEEVQNKEVVLKDLSEQKQIKVKIEDLIDKLDELLGVEEEHEHEHECHCGCGCECKDKKEE